MATEEIELKFESLREKEVELADLIAKAKHAAGVLDSKIQIAISGGLASSLAVIKDVELDIRVSVPRDKKAEVQATLEERRTSLGGIKVDFEALQRESDRARLAAGGATVDKANNTNDKIARQNEMIRQATATVGETEEVGAEIVENLGKNREKISSTQSKTTELNAAMDTAVSTTRSMSARNARQENCLVM